MTVFSCLTTPLQNVSTELFVVVVTDVELSKDKSKKSIKLGGKPSYVDYKQLNDFLGDSLTGAVTRGHFKGEPGTSHVVEWTGNNAIPSVLLVGASTLEVSGKSRTTFDLIDSYRKLGAAISRTAKRFRSAQVTLSAHGLDLQNEDNLVAFYEGLDLAVYTYENYRSKKESDPVLTSVREINFLGQKKISEKALLKAKEYTSATRLARDLINMPPNECTPAHLVKISREVSRKGGLKLQVFEESDLKRMGANSLLAVGAGSDEPPYLIKFIYQPKKRTRKTKVLSIVGKGVTFDSGGLCIKPDSSMDMMKVDMSGAAAVIATMQAVSRLKPDIEVRGYVPAAENMINGRAMRPGDVVKAMNGKTIEILNTDAEGRLILADALSLASQDKADVIIDLATLTGACVVALGFQYAAIFTDDDKLAASIKDSGDLAGERFWRLPLASEYRELLKSSIADMKNIGGRWGGAITAALFLKEFVSDAVWAHLDIAGTADSDKDYDHITKVGVGFGVRTLLNFIYSM